MKWIGQHIYDLIARFRSDVYLEDVSTGTIASGGNLGLDSNNKIVKATEATGDITGVTITTDSGGGSAASDTGGSADFSILGATGVGVTNSGTTITAVAVPGEIDHDSLNNFVAAEHYDWSGDNSGTATIHTNNITDLHGAGVDGLANQLLIDDGDGTVTSETNLTFDGTDFSCTADTVTFTSANADDPRFIIRNTTADNQGARLQLTKSRGAAMVQGDRVGELDFIGEDADQNSQQYGKILTRADVVTGGQESGKMILQVASHDGQLENAFILEGGNEDGEVDVTIGIGVNSIVTIPGNIDLAGSIDVDGTLETDALTIDGTPILARATDSAGGAVELATTGEADTGTDTARAVTPAGLKSHIDARYATSYLHFASQSTMLSSGNWVGPSGNGLNHHVWNLDYGVNTETNDTSEAAISRIYSQSGIRMPVACVIDGISGMSRNAGGSRQVTVGLFLARAADSNAVPFGTTNTARPKLQCHADTNNDSGDYINRAVHYEVTGANLAMAAGDVLYPAVKLTGVTSSGDTDSTYNTITIAFKTLIA